MCTCLLPRISAHAAVQPWLSAILYPKMAALVFFSPPMLAEKRTTDDPQTILRKYAANAALEVLNPVPAPLLQTDSADNVRRACRKDLDVAMQHASYVTGKEQLRVPLSALRHHHERRRLAMHVRAFMQDEAAILQHDIVPESPEIAIAFWHDVSMPVAGEPGSQPVALPDSAASGLRSAVQVGALSVLVYSYQCVLNAPTGVSCLPASDVVPWPIAHAFLQRGNHVALLSDVIRLKVIRHRVGYTWFLDCDTLWLRKASELVALLSPAAVGHFFGSGCQRASMPGLTRLRFEALQTVFYWARPRDTLFAQPPNRLLGIGLCSRILLAAVQQMAPSLFGGSGPEVAGRPFARPGVGRAPLELGWPFGGRWPIPAPLRDAPVIGPILAGSPCRDPEWQQVDEFSSLRHVPVPGSQPAEPRLHYQCIMDAWEWAVACSGLEVAVADWPLVAPIHYWSKDRVLKPACKSGYQPAASLFAGSYCVTNYWQSSKHVEACSRAVSSAGDFSRMHRLSTWANLLRIIDSRCAMPRRRITLKRKFCQVPAASVHPGVGSQPCAPRVVDDGAGAEAAAAASAQAQVASLMAQLASLEQASDDANILGELVQLFYEYRRTAAADVLLPLTPPAFRARVKALVRAARIDQ